MKVKVLYFAQFREGTGKTEETVEVSSDSSAGDLLGQIVSKFHSLAGIEKRVAVAVNREVVKKEARLKEGDEVVFLSPLAGG